MIDDDMGKAMSEGMKLIRQTINKLPDKKLKKQINSLLIGNVDALNKMDSNLMNSIKKKGEKLKKDMFEKHKDSIEDLKKWQ